MSNRFLVVDLETTGNKVGKDKIIQIGAILIEDGEIIERFSSFVNPNMKLSPFIKQFTRIEDEMLEKASSFELLAPMLLEMLEDSYFVAHNVPFDFSFLKAELVASGYELSHCPTIDTVELSRLLYPTLSGYKLSQLADTFAIEHEAPHRADSDAEVTAHLLMKLLAKLRGLPLTTLCKLESFASHFQSNIGSLLKGMIEHKNQSLLKNKDDWFDIHHRIALKPRKIISLVDNHPVVYPLNIESIITELQKEFSKFELRQGQIEMIEAIKEAFQNHHHALIEAGTGTGKTLGYLIPAILFAKQTGGRVVISTYTTLLQEQIITQEINILKKAFPFSFHATLLKGRNHYLCLRKFQQSIESYDSDNYDTILTKSQILIWLTETIDGDVDELNLSSGGTIFWNKVKSESQSCHNQSCPWYSRCFYQLKRKEAEIADIIITNHALLLSDMKAEYSIIPPYSEVVIDEAHHFEEVTSEHLGIQLDYFSIQATLNQFGLLEGTELLKSIHNCTNGSKLNVLQQIQTLTEHHLEAKSIIDELFRGIRSYVLHKNPNSKNEVGRVCYRYHLAKETGPLWKEVKNYAYIAIEKLQELASSTKSLIHELQSKESQLPSFDNGIVADIKSLMQSVEGIADSLCDLLFDVHTNKVTWVEIEPKGALNSTFLFCQSLDTSDILANRFFAKKQSVILTSATLAIKDSFEYIKSSLGILDIEVNTKMIPSPFLYKEQVKLMIPSDVPEIKDVDQDTFIQQIANRIIQIARVTQGRMLILFTAYDMLEKTYFTVKANSELDSFVLIAQGISSGSRAKLTKNFKQHNQAILFGTSSFWEGIDIPGEDLSCIVIVKLPFSPPDNPIMAAKAEVLKKERKNAFMDLYLPQAILRFKQGFGRLVRAKNDRGVVFVLDRRITTKSYGKKFIHALPPIDIYEEETNKLIEKLSDWL